MRSRKVQIASCLFSVAGLFSWLWVLPATAQAQPVSGAPKELKIGIVTFLSGPASSTFGIPAKNAADLWIEKINREGGIGGAKIVSVVTDEAGSADKVVTDPLWIKLFQGELSAEISKLLAAGPDVVFHSLWGTDLAALGTQGKLRGLFKQSLVVHNNSGAQCP